VLLVGSGGCLFSKCTPSPRPWALPYTKKHPHKWLWFLHVSKGWLHCGRQITIF
jgi:hypothetical protein